MAGVGAEQVNTVAELPLGVAGQVERVLAAAARQPDRRVGATPPRSVPAAQQRRRRRGTSRAARPSPAPRPPPDRARRWRFRRRLRHGHGWIPLVGLRGCRGSTAGCRPGGGTTQCLAGSSIRSFTDNASKVNDALEVSRVVVVRWACLAGSTSHALTTKVRTALPADHPLTSGSASPTGEWPPGHKLPSTKELADIYDVRSQSTVRRAGHHDLDRDWRAVRPPGTRCLRG